METFSAQLEGTLTIIKEISPTNFAVEQSVQTKESAKQMVWDSKTNRILLIAADYSSAPPPPAGKAGRPRANGAGFVFNSRGEQVDRSGAMVVRLFVKSIAGGKSVSLSDTYGHHSKYDCQRGS